MRFQETPYRNFRNRNSHQLRQEEILRTSVIVLNLAVLAGLFYLSALVTLRPTHQISRLESGLIVTAAAVLLVSSYQLIRVSSLRHKLQVLADSDQRDELTGALSLESFDDHLQEEIRRASRYHYPLTLCSLDVDGYSSFKDHFGREKSQALLKRFGRFCMGNIRSSDKFGRMREEEFALLLPHTDLVRSEKVLSRLLKDASETLDCSFSVGLTSYKNGETQSQFKSRAKLALDQAKKDGSKQIRCLLQHDEGVAAIEF